jgi:hypothetical protein
LVTEREEVKMSFYSTLCEISGSLSSNGGGSANGHTSSNGNGYGFQEVVMGMDMDSKKPLMHGSLPKMLK